ncbi:glutaredoxin family protein [Paeniglutamicibacter antarcticus]|uniref:Glutaredoxin family protein n=1 Tax=Arthrobacter terrae TaxID=2935737 RepID=A0A931G7F9_9MICC|nr:glutaredoxin family protein [Arthrobacter terrae]
MLTITVYSKPGCFGCRKTAEKFTTQGIPFQEVDLTTTPAALEYVSEELGYSQAPVIVVDDHFHWSGLRPDMIEEAIAAFHTQASTPATAGAGE